MAIAGGLSAQLGIAEEVTPGTAVTPDRFYEFNSESLALDIERIESAGLRPNRRVLGASDWVAGRQGVSGDIELEVQPNGFGRLIKHMLGSVATTTPSGATNARLHTGTIGALDGDSLTIQVGRTGVDGTTRSFTYAGCKINEWELSCSVDEFLMLTLGIDGMTETTATALASAAYPSVNVPLVWTQGAVTVAGSAFDVTAFSLSGSNGLATDRYFISATTPNSKRQQLESTLREYTGTLEAEFTDLTAYNRFVNGTTAALTATFTGPLIEGALNYSVTITLPTVRFDGETPSVDGEGIIGVSLPFKVLSDDITIAVQNTDTTA